jgi:hypothetical protein
MTCWATQNYLNLIFVNEALRNVRKRGIDLAQTAPHNYAERHPEAVSSTYAIHRYAGHTCHWPLKLGMKLCSMGWWCKGLEIGHQNIYSADDCAWAP